MLEPITLILLTISSNSTIFISSNYSSKDRSLLPFCTSFIAPSSMLKLWSMPSQRVYMWAWPLSSFVASLLWLADHKFLFQTVEVGLLQICENQNYVSRKIDQDQLIKPSVTILFHEVRQLYEEQKKMQQTLWNIGIATVYRHEYAIIDGLGCAHQFGFAVAKVSDKQRIQRSAVTNPIDFESMLQCVYPPPSVMTSLSKRASVFW